MTTIAIIDYDAGNIGSVEKAVASLGETPLVTSDPTVILSADRVILPGVGNFGDAMHNLVRFQLPEVIREVTKKDRPFLGICVGLQLLFEESEESPGIPGLGLLPGRIRRIPPGEGRKIPHMGWNSLDLCHGAEKDSFLRNLESPPYVYFVHSYYLEAAQRDFVCATTEYGVTIDAAVERGNLHACQFHPEKSGRTGLKILDNFLHP